VRRPVALLTAPRLTAAIRTLAEDRVALAASRATITARYSIRRLAAQLGALYASINARGKGSNVTRA
jgi:hypothetical protein